MATIKEINHDSSTTVADFYDIITNAGLWTITPAAALNGTTNGLNVAIGTGGVEEAFTLSSDDFRMRFRIKLDNVTNNNAGVEFLTILLGQTGAADFAFKVIIQANAGDSGFNVIVDINQDGKNPNVQLGDGTDVIASSGDVCIELRAIRESGGGNDGEAELFVNGVSIDSDTTLENRTKYTLIDVIQVLISDDADLTGDLDYDQWLIDDDNTITTLCNPALTLAPMLKPVSVDVDETNLYIALLQNGLPILVKMATALNANGSTVFNPGSGDDIGVQCGFFDASIVWIAGAFDGTNRVEKSEDSGSSFTVKDDGIFGDVEAFVVGPNDDNRVLVFDETNNDILETIDDGATWTTINASVTPIINAIARLDVNPEETVFGNESVVNDNVDYTVNTGTDLEDLNLPVSEDVTRIIVN